MGGTLDVTTTLGQGSTFWVELPPVEGPVERYERLNSRVVPPTPEPVGQQRPRHTVLYIEDNLSNLKLLERMLGQQEVEVIAAMQGRLGLELAREHCPALVLLDLHLPDLGGDQVLQQLRDDPATSAIPVMVSAGRHAEAGPAPARHRGHRYLTKPLDVRELLRLVDEALADAER